MKSPKVEIKAPVLEIESSSFDMKEVEKEQTGNQQLAKKEPEKKATQAKKNHQNMIAKSSADANSVYGDLVEETGADKKVSKIN